MYPSEFGFRILTPILLVVPICASADGAYQCLDKDKNIRVVTTSGSVMTVVNPKTPNIVFSKESNFEQRGNIKRYENDSWLFYDKEGIGSLSNKVFGDEYGCMQTGQSPDP
jgi:hypothetical protein